MYVRVHFFPTYIRVCREKTSFVHKTCCCLAPRPSVGVLMARFSSEKLADEFNSAYKTNAAVAIRVRTQLYTLDEIDPEKQVFAVIVVTGVLKEDIKP